MGIESARSTFALKDLITDGQSPVSSSQGPLRTKFKICVGSQYHTYFPLKTVRKGMAGVLESLTVNLTHMG